MPASPQGARLDRLVPGIFDRKTGLTAGCVAVAEFHFPAIVWRSPTESQGFLLCTIAVSRPPLGYHAFPLSINCSRPKWPAMCLTSFAGPPPLSKIGYADHTCSLQPSSWQAGHCLSVGEIPVTAPVPRAAEATTGIPAVAARGPPHGRPRSRQRMPARGVRGWIRIPGRLPIRPREVVTVFSTANPATEDPSEAALTGAAFSFSTPGTVQIEDCPTLRSQLRGTGETAGQPEEPCVRREPRNMVPRAGQTRQQRGPFPGRNLLQH